MSLGCCETVQEFQETTVQDGLNENGSFEKVLEGILNSDGLSEESPTTTIEEEKQFCSKETEELKDLDLQEEGLVQTLLAFPAIMSMVGKVGSNPLSHDFPEESSLVAVDQGEFSSEAGSLRELKHQMGILAEKILTKLFSNSGVAQEEIKELNLSPDVFNSEGIDEVLSDFKGVIEKILAEFKEETNISSWNLKEELGDFFKSAIGSLLGSISQEKFSLVKDEQSGSKIHDLTETSEKGIPGQVRIEAKHFIEEMATKIADKVVANIDKTISKIEVKPTEFLHSSKDGSNAKGADNGVELLEKTDFPGKSLFQDESVLLPPIVKHSSEKGGESTFAFKAKGSAEEAVEVQNSSGVASSLKLDDGQSFVSKIASTQGMVENEKGFLDQVIRKFQVLLLEGRQEAHLHLEPKELGALRIKIVIENGMISAKLEANNPMVKSILEANLTNLKQSLQDRGFDVKGFQVSVGEHFQASGEDDRNKQFLSQQGFAEPLSDLLNEEQPEELRSLTDLRGSREINCLA